MQKEKMGLLPFLTKREEISILDDKAFLETFSKNIGSAFKSVEAEIALGNKNEFFLKGGRGSLKSSYISLAILKLLRYCEKGNALVLRKVGATMRDTVFAQLLWAIDTLGLSDEWEAFVSPMHIVNKRTRQEIMFRGLDDPRKIKSIRPKRGYFRAVWFEEGEEYDGYAEIRSVMQSAGRGKRANAISFISYNPPKSANSWINKEAFIENPLRFVHHSSYLEAPKEWLGERFIREAEKLKQTDELAYRHEYLGESVGTGGNVFNNVKIRRIERAERELMRPVYHGMDFGFSKDPSTLMTVYFDEGEKRIFILEEFYKAGAGYDLLEKEIKKRTAGGGEVFSDVLPMTVAELKNRGCRVSQAKKGQKSRTFGLMWLEELSEIVIDPLTCPNAAREFSSFEHPRDRVTGEFRADYPDGDDHTIDAVRYALFKIIFKSKRKKYFSGKGAV